MIDRSASHSPVCPTIHLSVRPTTYLSVCPALCLSRRLALIYLFFFRSSIYSPTDCTPAYPFVGPSIRSHPAGCSSTRSAISPFIHPDPSRWLFDHPADHLPAPVRRSIRNYTSLWANPSLPRSAFFQPTPAPPRPRYIQGRSKMKFLRHGSSTTEKNFRI